MSGKVELITVFGVKEEKEDTPKDKTGLTSLFSYKGVREREGVEIHVSGGIRADAIQSLAQLLGSGCVWNEGYTPSSPQPEFRFSYVPYYDSYFLPSGRRGRTVPLDKAERTLFAEQFLKTYRATLTQPKSRELGWGHGAICL